MARRATLMLWRTTGRQGKHRRRPFVGPAGRLLDRAIAEAGIERSTTFVTNAVKHFKHEPRGKRRLHERPNTYEIERCRWSLTALASRGGNACRRCPLYKNATQAVPGAGPRRATLMLVGEQPGDKEDIAGEPFVGPAGRLLDRAIAEAGIERSTTFVTNAVKHFVCAR